MSTTLAGCRIERDSQPRDIPPDDRPELIQVDEANIATTGASRIFLLGPDQPGQARQLESVQRDVDVQSEPLLTSLFTGPSASELSAGIDTAVPSGTTLRSARIVGGVLTVDISPEILNLAGDLLLFAVAQIVFTGSQLDGVDGVRIRVDEQDRAWPTGSGVLSSNPLTVYDFVGYVQSSQPDFPAVPSNLPA